MPHDAAWWHEINNKLLDSLIMNSFESTPLIVFGITIAIFHISEILLVLAIEPEEFGAKSALFSPPYLIAMCCGVFEYVIRSYFLPLYSYSSISLAIGIVMVIVGEIIRKTAWLTARASFTHLIKDQRRSQHELVSTGIYSVFRHPGYFGWSLWALGTQVVLSNVICTLAFAVVIWRFFRERIEIEEFCLLRMFGNDYREYRNRVPTRIPGIR